MDFITSHAVENIELLEDEEVKNLLVNMNRRILIKSWKTNRSWTIFCTSYAMEAKKNQEIALENAKDAVLKVAKELKRFLEEAMDYLKNTKQKMPITYVNDRISCWNSKTGVDDLRAKGKKVGVIKLRCSSIPAMN